MTKVAKHNLLKIILVTCLTLALLFVGACSPRSISISIGDEKASSEEVVDECFSSSDCNNEGICIDRKCYSNAKEFEAIFLSKNEPCCNDGESWCLGEYEKKNIDVISCSSLPCENCDRPNPSCKYLAGGNDNQKYFVTKCVPCSVDFHCMDGFVCKNDQCVKE